jgi:hypothetical protein
VRAAAFVTFVRRMSLIGTFVWLASAALAAEPKPDASIRNKSIEASVFLDDKIDGQQ